ncbi:MAG: hypothetical protein PWQ39_401 [Thermacetogenium sp.]|nr:hypothetical protein [Thermacetogenium sp.]
MELGTARRVSGESDLIKRTVRNKKNLKEMKGKVPKRRKQRAVSCISAAYSSFLSFSQCLVIDKHRLETCLLRETGGKAAKTPPWKKCSESPRKRWSVFRLGDQLIVKDQVAPMFLYLIGVIKTWIGQVPPWLMSGFLYLIGVIKTLTLFSVSHVVAGFYTL